MRKEMMMMMMSSTSSGGYRSIQKKVHAKVEGFESSEETFWGKFRFPILTKQYSAVTSIHFSPTEPYDYAICSSTRVLIFDHETNQVHHKFLEHIGTFPYFF